MSKYYVAYSNADWLINVVEWQEPIQHKYDILIEVQKAISPWTVAPLTCSTYDASANGETALGMPQSKYQTHTCAAIIPKGWLVSDKEPGFGSEDIEKYEESKRKGDPMEFNYWRAPHWSLTTTPCTRSTDPKLISESDAAAHNYAISELRHCVPCCVGRTFQVLCLCEPGVCERQRLPLLHQKQAWPVQFGVRLPKFLKRVGSTPCDYYLKRMYPTAPTPVSVRPCGECSALTPRGVDEALSPHQLREHRVAATSG